MERILTKTRALALLVVVLVIAALNRHDAILYTIAVTLAAMAVLGHALPWLALRSATLLPAGEWPDQVEAAEGTPLALALRVVQGPWPAWLVEVEAEWRWGGRRVVTRDVVPFLRPHASVPVLGDVRFGCRGRYRLTALRLRSGFPLGLVIATREVPLRPLSVLVRPRASAVEAPAAWTPSEDLAGDKVLAHAGDSMDLHMLRAYEPGDALRRVDWRASARAGDLVVRQFQQPAATVVHVAVQLPAGDDIGRSDAPGEHAVRAAAGLCDRLSVQAVRCVVDLPGRAPVCEPQAVAAALADALTCSDGWACHLQRVAGTLRRGEQLVAVVPVGCETDALLQAARAAQAAGGRLLVLVARWPGASGEQMLAAAETCVRLKGAGVESWLA